MLEQAPDRPDYDEYDAELARVRRHRKKIAGFYERQENNTKEKEIEEYELISN